MRRALICLASMAMLTTCVQQPATAAVQGEVTEPNDIEHDHTIVGAIKLPSGTLVLQNGQFECKAPARRGVYLQRDRFFVVCWTADPQGLHLDAENGQYFDLTPEAAQPKGLEG